MKSITGQSALYVWLSNMREETSAQRLLLPQPHTFSIITPYKTFSSKAICKIWLGWSRCCVASDDVVSSVVFSPASSAWPALKRDVRRRADDIVCCTATDVNPCFAVLITAFKTLQDGTKVNTFSLLWVFWKEDIFNFVVVLLTFRNRASYI